MAKFTAVLVHGEREGEGHYTFDAPEDLLKKTPVKVMRAFMEYVESHAQIGHIEYAINAAMKNKDVGIVTILGELEFEKDSVQPFMCMISSAKD